MADIFIRCPSIGCRQVLNVPVECRGLLVTCKFCKRMLRIPQARAVGKGPAAAAAAAAAAGGAVAGAALMRGG